MSKKFKLKVNVKDKWDWHAQSVIDENKKLLFSVCDLTECPEDAIIGRDLFDANDYIDTLHLGMQLAKEGYDDIEVEWVEVKDDE